MSIRLVVTVAFPLLVSVVQADVEIPREHHPWGRFAPGSWSRIRETREWQRDGESGTYISETQQTLLKVDADGVVIKLEVTEGDKVVRTADVQRTWDGWSVPLGKSAEELRKAGLSAPGPVKYSLGEVDVDGTTYACQTQHRTSQSTLGERSLKSWYAPDQSPYYLKRIRRLTGKAPDSTIMRVTRLAVEKEVLGKQLVCWESEVRFTGTRSRSQSTSYHSMEVPGGLVLSDTVFTSPQAGIQQKIHREVVAYEAKLPEGGNE